MLSPYPRTRGSLARRLKLVAGPVAEPIDFTLQKQALKVEINSDSFSTQMRIRTARQTVEKAINRKLVQQTWDMFIDDEAHVGDYNSFFVPVYATTMHAKDYLREITLPFPPVQQVLSIWYRDPNGVENIVDPSIYSVSTAAEPARIRLNNYCFWPEHQGFESFRIRFTCGYATPVTVNNDGTLAASNHGHANGDTVQFTSLDGTLPQPLEWGQSYVMVSLTPTSFAVTDLAGNVLTPDTAWTGTMFLGEVPSPLIEAMVLLSGLNLASQTPSRIPGVSTRLSGVELPLDPNELLSSYVFNTLV